jgi:hypothetical protein
MSTAGFRREDRANRPVPQARQRPIPRDVNVHAHLLVLDADLIVLRVLAKADEAGLIALRAFKHLRVQQLAALRAGQRLHLRLAASRSIRRIQRRPAARGRRGWRSDGRRRPRRCHCARLPGRSRTWSRPCRARAPLCSLQLEREGNLVIGPGRLMVQRREVVVVHVGDDGHLAGVLEDVLDGHLRLAFREPDGLRIDVAEVDRRLTERA